MKTEVSIIVIAILVLTHDVSAGASKACSNKCGSTYGTGTCQSDGTCLCWYGYTGPKSEFVKSGSDKGKIKAEHCEWSCHWTHVYQNPDCVDDNSGNCSGSGGESDEEES